MADIPSKADLFDAGRREALTLPTKFNPEIIDTEGSDINLALNSAAAMGEEALRFGARSFNETHLSTASQESEEALDRWGADRYQEERQGATRSIVPLVLARTDTILGFTVPRDSVFGTDDGVNFQTLNDVAFPAGEAGPFTVDAEAIAVGPDGNVDVGTISEKVSQLGDDTVSVTNLEVAAGGRNAQTNEEYQRALQTFFKAARRGTLDAIEFGALSAAGVVQATVIEVLDVSNGLPAGRVELIIADTNGQANAALARRVLRTLREFRGGGVPVLVIPGVPEFVEIEVVGLQFVAGSDTTSVLEQAVNAVVAAVNGLGPNIALRQVVITTALENIENLIVPDGAVIEPAGTLVPVTGRVLRTTKDRVSLSAAA